MRTSFYLLFVFAGGIIQAQDFYGAGVSAATARRAGIFLTSSESASDDLVLNPAGLASLSATVVDLSVSGIFARGSFSNASNNSSPMASNNGVIPFGAIGIPIGQRWTLAFGVAPDLLSASKWNYFDTPGFAGADYGLQRERSEIIGIRSAAGVAFKISKNFALGASFGADYNQNTLIMPYIFQSNPAVAGLKTLLDLHSNGYGLNSSYGFIARPTRAVLLNASYRTATDITSHGTASGNIGAQFQSLGIDANPTFAYNSQVRVKLPASALVSTSWQVSSATRLSFQADWINWHDSFRNLPVTLTNGNNATINSVVGSSTLQDTVPLRWKDQYTFRGGYERSFGENISIGAGYLHGNNPVPNSTLSPLTAAIMQNGLTAGVGWHWGAVRFNGSYGFDFTARQHVDQSQLLYDEYSNSTTKIGTQAVTLSASFKL